MQTKPPALLIIDMFSKFDFPQAPAIEASALAAARKIAVLRRHFQQLGYPTIYANDNFCDWKRDFREHVQACLQTPGTSAEIARLLLPTEDDYAILKPKHSAFLASPLVILLAKLGVERLVVVGMAADSCVAATCFDANSREYDTVVVKEAVAGSGQSAKLALAMLEGAKAAKVMSMTSFLKTLPGAT